MSDYPVVSVITAAYNAEDTIERCLRSVRDQTVPSDRIEHLVVDDKSTDGTVDLVRTFDSPNLRLIETEHSGATPTMNHGLELANGEYVVLLDSDDRFLPKLVERMANILDQNESADYVTCDYYEEPIEGERETVYVDPESVHDLLTNGVMHRRSVMSSFGFFDESMYFSEYDLYLRCQQAGRQRVHVDEPLFVYHRNPHSQTKNKEWVLSGKQELRDKYGEDVEIRDY